MAYYDDEYGSAVTASAAPVAAPVEPVASPGNAAFDRYISGTATFGLQRPSAAPGLISQIGGGIGDLTSGPSPSLGDSYRGPITTMASGAGLPSSSPPPRLGPLASAAAVAPRITANPTDERLANGTQQAPIGASQDSAPPNRIRASLGAPPAPKRGVAGPIGSIVKEITSDPANPENVGMIRAYGAGPDVQAASRAGAVVQPLSALGTAQVKGPIVRRMDDGVAAFGQGIPFDVNGRPLAPPDPNNPFERQMSVFRELSAQAKSGDPRGEVQRLKMLADAFGVDKIPDAAIRMAEMQAQKPQTAIAAERLALDTRRAAREETTAGLDQADKRRRAALEDKVVNGTPEEKATAAQALAAFRGRDVPGVGKPMPASAAKALLENQTNLRRAQTALDLVSGKTVDGMVGDTAATGLKGYLPNQLLNRVDPAGVDTRAAVADLGSLVIHDRSGAAVTAAEFPRLAPFIPTEKDDSETAKKKLSQFMRNYAAVVDDQVNFFSAQGYKVPASVLKSGGAGDGVPAIKGDDDYAALPKGARFMAPDGKMRVKP